MSETESATPQLVWPILIKFKSGFLNPREPQQKRSNDSPILDFYHASHTRVFSLSKLLRTSLPNKENATLPLKNSTTPPMNLKGDDARNSAAHAADDGLDGEVEAKDVEEGEQVERVADREEDLNADEDERLELHEAADIEDSDAKGDASLAVNK